MSIAERRARRDQDVGDAGGDTFFVCEDLLGGQNPGVDPGCHSKRCRAPTCPLGETERRLSTRRERDPSRVEIVPPGMDHAYAWLSQWAVNYTATVGQYQNCNG